MILDYVENIPVRSITCDICDLDGLKKALVGVNAVIHTASVVDVEAVPNNDLLEKVNVQGQTFLWSMNMTLCKLKI